MTRLEHIFFRADVIGSVELTACHGSRRDADLATASLSLAIAKPSWASPRPSVLAIILKLGNPKLQRCELHAFSTQSHRRKSLTSIKVEENLKENNGS